MIINRTSLFTLLSLLLGAFCPIASPAPAGSAKSAIGGAEYEDDGDGDNYRRLVADPNESIVPPALWRTSSVELAALGEAGVCALGHPGRQSSTKEEEEAQLGEIVGMFEQALDHLARAAEYAAKLRPLDKGDQVREFDRTGALAGLRISQDRLALLDKYKSSLARGASQEERSAILGEFYFKACASKMSMVVAEGSMFESLLKLGGLMEKEEKGEEEEEAKDGQGGLRGVKVIENYFS